MNNYLKFHCFPDENVSFACIYLFSQVILINYKCVLMRVGAFLLFLCMFSLLFAASAQISISSLTTAYTQQFNSLKTSKTSSTLPPGWRISESGSSANTTYAADMGASNTGNTYSYGSGTQTDRALGMLRSAALIPTAGVQFINATGQVLTSITVNYTGEQWRCGATGRTDQLDFQYSLNAVSLNSGTWVDVNALDFASLFVTTVGARDGNASGNRTQRSATITGLNIPNNAGFWLRWVDADASGADDGLAIDDFSMNVAAGDAVAPTIVSFSPVNNASMVTLNGTLGITFSEPVTKGAGSVQLKRTSDGSVAQSWQMSDAAVLVNNSNVSLPYTGLSYSTGYYVEIAAGAIKDLGNNSFAGVSGSTTWNFHTLPPPDTLKVINWNIEWFGGSLGPANDSLQEENVKKVMTNINADIYGLSEVVSAARLQNIVSQMPGYGLFVGDFCSNFTNCTNAQKLAFVYRTSVIQPIRAYAVLKQGGSDSAYYNWSSGRFPYLLEADVKMNGVTQRIQFIVIHAKANTSDYIVSYNRRRAGAKELRDTLAVQYPSSNWIVMGDYNDDLDKTITTQLLPDTTTSYISFKNDATFRNVTLPLSLAGIPSTASYKDIIDHVTLSDDMHRFYIANSARVLKDEVISWITDYSNTTSDHYPVATRYVLSNAAPLPVALPALITKKATSEDALPFRIHPLPGQLQILPPMGDHNPYEAALYSLSGQRMIVRNGTDLINMSTSNFVPGVYILQIRSARFVTVQKVLLR
jgi:endonuclease/exonuclease/phosphatase family metal-dependent hydrolase